MSKNLNPGDVLPDFQLPDENGDLHRLSELQGDNAMVLMLGRGEHCPRERQHQFEMRQLAQWAPVAFTEMVTVLPGELHDVFKMKIATGAYWPYLCDIDLEVREALEIDEYTDEHHDYATVPHTLVLAPGLVIDKVYVGYWFWGRPSPYQLWDDLADLHKRIKPDFDPTTADAREAWKAMQAEPAAAR
jgi:peroxiredoxin